MSEEFFLRDDIIEFNQKLDAQCFNINAYRKKKSKSKKMSVLGALTTDLGFSQENILKSDRSMDRRDFSVQQNSTKRISVTAGMNRHRKAQLSQNLRNFNMNINIRTQLTSHKKQSQSEIKTAKINYNTSNEQNSQFHLEHSTGRLINKRQRQSEPKSKYHQIQHRFHKNGPVNDRGIQNWLNQILMEYCHEEHFDKSIQNAALKKMNIDRNSLLSQGINPDYVNRVYKSMFVYSIGFNNLLKQLSGKNTNLKKTIWKVYAILLQFCSEGTFQTMIGQIERDKAKKVESLRQEIQKRQYIIQNNDQINKEKNAKIFKELKILKQQNTNLQNQKNVLMQQFKQAEQSFNQQVSMRLKFENKINQIHGIHHQLSTKHARLYDDYHKKVQEIQILEQRYKQTSQNYLVLKQKLSRTQEQLEETKRDNLALNELIQKYEQMRTRFQNSQIQLKNSKQDLLNIIKQKNRKISQLQVQLENSEIMLNLSKSSFFNLEFQYKEQLEENKKLYTTIRDQINQLNQLFTEKKNFNQKHMSYVAEIEFLKNKDSENRITIEKLKKQICELTQNHNLLLLQKLSLDKKVTTLQNNLKDCYENIQNMKRTKNIYQEELIYLKKKSQIHGQVVRDKDVLITSLTKSNQKLNKQNQQLITLNKNLDSKQTVLAQKLRSQEQINKKKYEKLKEERDQLFKENSQHNAILKEKINQLEKYMSLYDKEMLHLKNERFERVNLDLRYKQSLQVMESQNQHIKKLNIIISQNHEQIEEWKRKYRNFEYILKQKEHLFQVQKNSLKMYLEEARKEVNKKKMFVNPMLLEDLSGLLKRSIEKYESLSQEYNKKIVEFRNKEKQLYLKLQNQKNEYIQRIEEQDTKAKKKLQEKQNELEYQKEKGKHLQYKIQEFQKLMNKLKNEGQSPTINKEKERKYLNTIKEKAEQIQKLLKQLQSAHDHNNTLIKRISQIENIISAKNNEITEFEKKITKLNQQYEALQRQKAVHANRQKQTLSSKMDDYDDNLLAVMNNDNHLQPNLSQRQNSTRNQVRSGQHSRQNSARSKKMSSQEEVESRDQQIQNQQNNHKSKRKEEKVVNPVWRNDFGKKLKNAFNYYQK